MKLALPARAKLNLDLEVTGRTDDGFHQLRTTFQAIDLHDLLELEPAGEATFTTSGFDIAKANNSVLNAHKALEEAAKKMLPVNIHLHKRIPPGSGMGGASSDAATTLWALKTMFGLDVDLMHIAQQLGSDVPFFLTGGRAHAEGRGEKLRPLECHDEWYAIAWPGIELSTANVYRAWDEVKGEAPNHLRRAAEQVEPRLKEFARNLGAGWQMTGSGSAFFKQTDTQREAKEEIAQLDCWTVVSRAVPPWA
ncbi:MAG TPA: 4-(cytidine 5'-diphospho)-2-C-methyl-D-erythritol kinase [Candidatus Dormibacteraeota bacterium]